MASHVVFNVLLPRLDGRDQEIARPRFDAFSFDATRFGPVVVLDEKVEELSLDDSSSLAMTQRYWLRVTVPAARVDEFRAFVHSTAQTFQGRGIQLERAGDADLIGAVDG